MENSTINIVPVSLFPHLIIGEDPSEEEEGDEEHSDHSVC